MPTMMRNCLPDDAAVCAKACSAVDVQKLMSTAATLTRRICFHMTILRERGLACPPQIRRTRAVTQASDRPKPLEFRSQIRVTDLCLPDQPIEAQAISAASRTLVKSAV